MKKSNTVPTMKDVARRAKVSTATVSAVINGSSFVSDLLRERVLRAIERLNYAPSGVARSLRTRSTRLIGLIVPDITNPFFTQFVRRVGAAVQVKGYSTLLCETNHDATQEAAALQLLAAHGVDGLILAPTGPSKTYLRQPQTFFPKPVVMADRVVVDAPFDSVCIDSKLAAYDLTNHLISLGHKRIAIVAGAKHLANTLDRLAGFEEAMAAAKLKVDPSLVIYADFVEDRSRELCRSLLMRADRPSALFVSNNQMLIGALEAMSDLSLVCPQDISIVSIDDFAWANIVSPRMTVQVQPIDQIADTAVRLLLSRMTLGNTSAPEHVFLPTALVLRESTRAIDPQAQGNLFKSPERQILR